jgi:membrane protease subunit HflC
MSLRLVVALLAVLLAVTVLLWRVAVIVDETQFVLVTSFGRPVAVYGDGQSGLHAKWPWQSVTAIDRRLQVSDPPPREVISVDKKNLEVASYVVWRVADPERFLRSVGTLEAAALRLDERIAASLSDAIGSRTLDSLASTDPSLWKLDELTGAIVKDVAAPARKELGIEVVDVRLRRFNYPVEVRSSVFELIRSERRKVAATLRAEGEAAYQTARGEADRERDLILARADAEAERIRAQGEAEATRTLNEAHARDPRFYEFLRTLETYAAILDEKATVVLSASSPLLRLLTQGPAEDLMESPSPPSPGTPIVAPAPAPVAGSGTEVRP